MSKIIAPKMVYIGGSQMSAAAMRGNDTGLDLKDDYGAIKQLVDPYVDRSAWEFFDYGIPSRKDSNDQVVKDGFRRTVELGSAFKEQTITPEDGSLPSPNNEGRKIMNGVVIYRNTIHPTGADTVLGWANKVFTARYPLGEGYGIKKDEFMVTKVPSKVTMTVTPEDGSKPFTVTKNVAEETRLFIEHTPLANFKEMIRDAFNTSIENNVRPIWLDKGTAKQQHAAYRDRIEQVEDEKIINSDKTYREVFGEKGWLTTDNSIEMILSDAGVMRIVGNNRGQNEGGFMFIGPNYEMDIMQDGVAQKQKNPAMVDSVLAGKRDDGVIVKLFDAGHGTDPRNYQNYLDGKFVSFDTVSQLTGLWNAMEYSAKLASPEKLAEVQGYTIPSKQSLYSVVGANLVAPEDKKMSTSQMLQQTAQGLAKEMAKSRMDRLGLTQNTNGRNGF